VDEDEEEKEQEEKQEEEEEEEKPELGVCRENMSMALTCDWQQ